MWLICCLPILLPMGLGLWLLKRRPGESWRLCFGGALLTLLSGGLLLLLPGRLELAFTESLSLLLAPDGLSRFFLLLIAGGFAAAALYSREYFAGDREAGRFYGFLLLTLWAMMGLAQAGNIVSFYMFYEMMSLFSFPLVLYEGGEKARRAAMVYLGFSVFGACLALMGMLLGGELSLRAFSAGAEGLVLSRRLLWAFFLMALGFSCKAGMMPLANWLPVAHPVAPAPASALLSGIITKAGILGMLRTAYYLFGVDSLAGTLPQKLLLGLSMLTIFTGSMLAYKEQQLKKRLAYSSVSQLSYVIFGLMLLSREGFAAALLQLFFHACAKVGLFLCAGAFIRHAGCHYVDELRGIGRRMPATLGAFSCFSLSLIGLPPFGGFVSKWELAAAALGEGSALAHGGVLLLLVSALLTAGYLLPVMARGWFPGEEYQGERCEAGPAMLLPLWLLAALTALPGLFPGGLWRFFMSLTAGIL